MANDEISPERALIRLQQLAREERNAISIDDVDALCQVAALLPRTIDLLLNSPLANSPALRDVMEDVLEANEEAEAYLLTRMGAISEKLQYCAATKRSLNAYSNRPPHWRLNERR